MTQPYSQELKTALEAVRRAAAVCRAVQAEIDVEALDKKDKSPVTIADFASQAVVCQCLAEDFPDDPMVAEEDSTELRRPEQQPFLQRIVEQLTRVGLVVDADTACRWIDWGFHDGTASRFWTLDPIDGTKGFLRKEQYAISLALIVGGRVEVAALCCPNLSGADAWDRQRGAVFGAVRGGGASLYLLDEPHPEFRTVRVSGTSKPSTARVCESVESGHSAHEASAAIFQRLGIMSAPVRLDSQAKYGVVARGEADIYLRMPTRADYQEKIWDHAGGVLVVEEAGGRVTDIEGQPLDFSCGRELSRNRGVVVTNGSLHEAVLEAIAAVRST